MHIYNKHVKPGAQIIIKRKDNLVNKIDLRTSWSKCGIDIINKEHVILICTMISRIIWEDKNKKCENFSTLLTVRGTMTALFSGDTLSLRIKLSQL